MAPSADIVLSHSVKKILPVTLLSGFLGSGKTTLLQHILHNKQGLKCAVIVNDMSTLNIDASLIEKSGFLHQQEKLVKFQNGCICCTLRGDLLAEINRLATLGEFDYLVIESTGISEPMQVAETFAMTKEEIEAATSSENPALVSDTSLTSIVGISRLDTCVTVVDATTLFSFFEITHFISEEYENVEEADERTVVDLLVDQIEFANVILLNKIDVCSTKQLENCEALIKKLNPRATLIKTTYSKVDLSLVLNTNTFNFEQAAFSPGWLQSLKSPHVPETEEYGIGSFVYRSRRPFHPQRLNDVLNKYFFIIENSEDVGEYEDIEDDENEGESEMDEDMSVDGTITPEQEAERQANIAALLTAKKASPFRGVLRSKGFIWIATRPKNMGEISQAGMMLTLSNGGNWFCELPKSMWPVEMDVVETIKENFTDEVGDKRQEIVIIGQFQKGEKEGITKELDDCIVTDIEWEQCKVCSFEDWEDPFEDWTYHGDSDEEI